MLQTTEAARAAYQLRAPATAWGRGARVWVRVGNLTLSQSRARTRCGRTPAAARPPGSRSGGRARARPRCTSPRAGRWRGRPGRRRRTRPAPAQAACPPAGPRLSPWRTRCARLQPAACQKPATMQELLLDIHSHAGSAFPTPCFTQECRSWVGRSWGHAHAEAGRRPPPWPHADGRCTHAGPPTCPHACGPGRAAARASSAAATPSLRNGSRTPSVRMYATRWLRARAPATPSLAASRAAPWGAARAERPAGARCASLRAMRWLRPLCVCGLGAARGWHGACTGGARQLPGPCCRRGAAGGPHGFLCAVGLSGGASRAPDQRGAACWHDRHARSPPGPPEETAANPAKGPPAATEGTGGLWAGSGCPAGAGAPVQQAAAEAEQRAVLRVALAQGDQPQRDEARQLPLPALPPAPRCVLLRGSAGAGAQASQGAGRRQAGSGACRRACVSPDLRKAATECTPSLRTALQ